MWMRRSGRRNVLHDKCRTAGARKFTTREGAVKHPAGVRFSTTGAGAAQDSAGPSILRQAQERRGTLQAQSTHPRAQEQHKTPRELYDAFHDRSWLWRDELTDRCRSRHRRIVLIHAQRWCGRINCHKRDVLIDRCMCNDDCGHGRCQALNNGRQNNERRCRRSALDHVRGRRIGWC